MSSSGFKPAVTASPAMSHLALAMTPVALAVQFAIATSLYIPSANAQTNNTTASQAQSAALHNFNISAGTLSATLTQFLKETGIFLISPTTLTQGKNSLGVQGEMSIEAALEQLLSGTGLEAVSDNQGEYVLQASMAASITESRMDEQENVRSKQDTERNVLETIVVTGIGIDGITEGTGSYTKSSSTTATRLNMSLRDTPQSVSVMTRQQIEDLGIQSVEDVALQVTGLTLSRGAPERTTIRSRGFTINTIMIDGVPMRYDSDMTGSNTLSMYDHVEVLRGAAGLLQGTGNPSGTINLARKRPTKETHINLTGSVGRWDNYRAELDVGGALNDSGTIRGRSVVAWHDTGSFRQSYENERALFYGTLEFDLTANTTFSIGGMYNDEENQGSAWYGVPTYRNGQFLPISRSANYTPSWAYWDKKNLRVFADVEHQFQNGWKAKVSTQISNSELDALYNNLQRLAGSENMSFSFVGDSDYSERLRSVDVHASGPFELLGRTHELLVGGTYRKMFFNSTGRVANGYNFVFDPTQPSQVQNAPRPVLGGKWGNQNDRSEQYGSYVTTRLNIADPLKLILGARLDWYDYETEYNRQGSGYSITQEFTPYAGLVFDLNETYSIYGSWTRIFQPQSSKLPNGSLLEPVTGTNFEVGIKGEYLDGAVNTSLAAFKIIQENLARSLPNSECAPWVQSCAEASGEIESKGIEFEVAGQITPDWQVVTGYTFTTAKYTESTSSASAGDKFATEQPRHLFKLFTTYRLPGELNAWRIGGGIRFQSDIYRDTGDIRIRQASYALVDLMAAWETTPQLELRLNVNNLFDKYYYESIASPSNSNGFGAPRNILLTGHYKF